MLVKLRNQLVN